jgi:hypothetical protein
MLRRLHRPSPAMIVALIALFVALGGTAVAAGVPLAKRALSADNAKKLQGKTAAAVAATPGPASSAKDLVTFKTAPFALGPNAPGIFAATCDTGQKAITGGFTTAGLVISGSTAASPDGATFAIALANLVATPATGNVYAVCVK